MTNANKPLKKLIFCSMIIFYLGIQPVMSNAGTVTAKPELTKENPVEEKITPFSIAIFYAGMIGTVLGIATGWIIYVFMPKDNINAQPSSSPEK